MAFSHQLEYWAKENKTGHGLLSCHQLEHWAMGSKDRPWPSPISCNIGPSKEKTGWDYFIQKISPYFV